MTETAAPPRYHTQDEMHAVTSVPDTSQHHHLQQHQQHPHDSIVPSPAESDVSGKKSRMDSVGSRQSARVASSHTHKKTSANVVGSVSTTPLPPVSKRHRNPFKMPPDSDIFLLRDKERQRKKHERIRQRQLHVHEKTTYTSRVNLRNASMIQASDSEDDVTKLTEEDSDKVIAVKDDPQFTIAVTRERHIEKESLAEYIAKKREMFLVQYSLGVKRDEMRKLEEIAQAEERKLELAEQFLEEDAAMFDEFLKENDKNSVEAIKVAENEAKQKMEKVNEIKKINAQMMAIKSEISKYEDTLKEYQLYRQFLDKLTPFEEREQRLAAKRERKEARRRQDSIAGMSKKDSGLSPNAFPDKSTRRRTQHRLSKGSLPGIRRKSAAGGPRKEESQSDTETAVASDTDLSDEEDMGIYFKDPQQLLDIFAELEEQNLSLIQNSQETEETLDEMKQSIKSSKRKMASETRVLKEQIEKLETQIAAEEAKAAELKMKAKMFNYGEFKEEDQEKSLGVLNQKVEEVYRMCIGDNEAGIGTLQMLTNIENRLEELFETIETMPPDKVEAAEKAKEKERRLLMREEKLEQQRLHQEERVRKALERAKAEPKRVTGRKLVVRSEPPHIKKKVDDGSDQATREEEEFAYYFTW